MSSSRVIPPGLFASDITPMHDRYDCSTMTRDARIASMAAAVFGPTA